MALCPNCEKFVPWDAPDCIHCDVSFAPDSAYRPKLTRGWEFQMFDKRAGKPAAPCAWGAAPSPAPAPAAAHGVSSTLVHNYQVRRVAGGVSVGMPNPILMISISIGGCIFGLGLGAFMFYELMRGMNWGFRVFLALFYLLTIFSTVRMCSAMTATVISTRGVVARRLGPWRRFTDVGEPVKLEVEVRSGLRAFFSGPSDKAALRANGPDGSAIVLTGEADALADIRDEIEARLKNVLDT